MYKIPYQMFARHFRVTSYKGKYQSIFDSIMKPEPNYTKCISTDHLFISATQFYE